MPEKSDQTQPDTELAAERSLMSERWQKYVRTGKALTHEEVKNWAKTLPGSTGP